MPTIQTKSDPLPWKDSKQERDRHGRSPHAREKRYNTSRWRKLRIQVLDAEPLCRECQAKGRVVEARVVDHINPVRQGGAFWDINNLQPLCDPCHNSKSGKEGQQHNYS